MLRTDPSTWSDRRHIDGVEAEIYAAGLLKRCGYDVVEHRFRLGHHDVDLVARKGAMVVFVEVRYRLTSRFGTAAESVTAGKQHDITRVARLWMARNARPGDFARFDVIGVQGDRVEWLQSAFRPGWR